MVRRGRPHQIHGNFKEGEGINGFYLPQSALLLFLVICAFHPNACLSLLSHIYWLHTTGANGLLHRRPPVGPDP